MWWVLLAQTPWLLPSLRQGRAIATETQATSGPLAPRVRCHPRDTPLPSGGMSSKDRQHLAAGALPVLPLRPAQGCGILS